MATEQNATWFDGALAEFVQEEPKKSGDKQFPTPMLDALPRSPHGLTRGWWFDESISKPRFLGW